VTPGATVATSPATADGTTDDTETASRARLASPTALKGCFERMEGGRSRNRGIAGDALSAKADEIEAAFRAASDGASGFPVTLEKFMPITTQLCGMPSIFNAPLFRRVASLSTASTDEHVTHDDFVKFWRDDMEPFDHLDRFFRLVKSVNADAIVREDLDPFVEELLHTHPGLAFLKDHREFQDKYALTVTVRIFYRTNMSRSGKISARELRSCEPSLLEAFHQVDQDDDINNENSFFSYEHFYVLYCRFWELDFDHDALLSREDLLKYGGHRLSRAIVDRIFDVAVRPFCDGCGQSSRDEMRYADFVYFMLSEEDKGNEASIQFWFPCVDIDGDGAVSAHDMRFFYDMQSHRMECLGHEVRSPRGRCAQHEMSHY
jgi:serine/threonine-protein phosphatase 2A regulatory subunit B''